MKYSSAESFPCTKVSNLNAASVAVFGGLKMTSASFQNWAHVFVYVDGVVVDPSIIWSMIDVAQRKAFLSLM